MSEIPRPRDTFDLLGAEAADAAFLSAIARGRYTAGRFARSGGRGGFVRHRV